MKAFKSLFTIIPIVECCDITGMGGYIHFEKRARDGFIRWQNRTRREVSHVFGGVKEYATMSSADSVQQRAEDGDPFNDTCRHGKHFSGRFEIHDSNDR